MIESLGRKTIAQVSYNRTAAQYRVRQLSPATEWLLSEAEFLRICRGAVTAHMKIVDKPLFDGAIIARSANTMRELRGKCQRKKVMKWLNHSQITMPQWEGQEPPRQSD